MQKRYAELADRPERTDVPDKHGVEPAGTTPTISMSYGTKTFHIARRFEYRRLDRAPGDRLLDVEQLDALGADGWELSGTVSDGAGTHYYLKRGRGAAAAAEY